MGNARHPASVTLRSLSPRVGTLTATGMGESYVYSSANPRRIASLLKRLQTVTVQPDVGERPAVVVEASLRVGSNSKRDASASERRCANLGCLRPVALDRLRRVHGLGRVDADQPNRQIATPLLHLDGVTVDDSHTCQPRLTGPLVRTSWLSRCGMGRVAEVCWARWPRSGREPLGRSTVQAVSVRTRASGVLSQKAARCMPRAQSVPTT